MSRRSKPAKRIPPADPIYNSVDVSKFINRIMRRGKKSLAERMYPSMINTKRGKELYKPFRLNLCQLCIENRDNNCSVKEL